ncbi:MAG: hypothetical protein E4H15_05235 [Syntrophobacterales bacterium]|nr:MAG: hypothetical protein E4H15_05235 [Syntrophobacterales bacterium]
MFKLLHSIKSVFVLVIAIIFLFERNAFAYLDPATGSMIVQAVIAAVAAVSVSVGIFWKRLKSFFGRDKEDR